MSGKSPHVESENGTQVCHFRGGSLNHRADEAAQYVTTIIIPLKGTAPDFDSLLTALRTVSETHAPVSRAQSCANHMQHIQRLSRATCHVPCCTKGQSSWQSWNRIYFSFILLAETTNRWGRARNWSTQRHPIPSPPRRASENTTY